MKAGPGFLVDTDVGTTVAPLVTHDVRDFARVTGLRLADWPIG